MLHQIQYRIQRSVIQTTAIGATLEILIFQYYFDPTEPLGGRYQMVVDQPSVH